MAKHGRASGRGLSLLGIALVLAAAAGLGGAAFAIYKRSHPRASTAQTLAQKALHAALENARCDYDDDDLCKFFTALSQDQAHTIAIVSKQDDNETRTLVETESPTRAHFSVQGAAPYETITFDDVLYTRSGVKSWWKQALPAGAREKLDGRAGQFAEPTPLSSEDEVRISYNKLGTESCGDLTCFKYEMTDSRAPEGTHELVWFDTADYRVRRTLSTTPVSSSDASFTYGSVTVKAPTGAHELAPNQYLVPGQETPITLPAATN